MIAFGSGQSNAVAPTLSRQQQPWPKRLEFRYTGCESESRAEETDKTMLDLFCIRSFHRIHCERHHNKHSDPMCKSCKFVYTCASEIMGGRQTGEEALATLHNHTHLTDELTRKCVSTGRFKWDDINGLWIANVRISTDYKGTSMSWRIINRNLFEYSIIRSVQRSGYFRCMAHPIVYQSLAIFVA